MIVGDARLLWGYAARRSLLVVLAVLVVLIIAACDNSVANAPKPSVTATPALAHVQHLSLGDFQASSLMPMAHGLLLFGTPGTVGQPNDAPPESNIHPTALYYYDFTAGSLKRLVAIPPSSGASITLVGTGGDWVAFSTAADSPLAGDLRIINAVTHEQRTLVSTLDTVGVLSGFTTDGRLIVWATSAGNQHALHSYDLTSHQTKTLLSVTDPPLLNQILTPVAVDQGYILYSQHFTNNITLNKDPRVGLYLLNPGSSTLDHIGSTYTSNARMTSHYIIWDDAYNESLGLYDRQAGVEATAWASDCIRPDFAANGSYVACVDIAHKLATVIQVPSGKRTTLGPTVDYLNGTIVNNQVYWLVRTGETPFSNAIDAWPLPAA